MGVNYEPVLWNKFKKQYDMWMLLGVLILAGSFIVLQFVFRPNITIETLIIRTTALVAISLLHVILVIGPLSRLSSKFLPLLYNRRHLGVTMFLFAAAHGIFCILQFHSLGDVHPLISVFTSNLKYQEINQFPFQTLGFFALLIFFLMAATSHDFWLANLGPRTWKILHMSVYLAYTLVILHVITGIVQHENKPVYWILTAVGFLAVSGLHIFSGFKQFGEEKKKRTSEQSEGFYKVCPVSEINEDCARITRIGAQEIAIFKYGGQLSAVHNVCKHQMGPLGEGRIVDGCITCPWHGYQYLSENGQSPPPFEEKISTYKLKIIDGVVWVDPKPLPEGTFVEPAVMNNKK